MVDAQLGRKQKCSSCGIKFYDLNKKPVLCPTCKTEFDPESLLKSRRGRGAVKEEKRAINENETSIEASINDTDLITDNDSFNDEDSLPDDNHSLTQIPTNTKDGGDDEAEFINRLNDDEVPHHEDEDMITDTVGTDDDIPEIDVED